MNRKVKIKPPNFGFTAAERRALLVLAILLLLGIGARYFRAMHSGGEASIEIDGAKLITIADLDSLESGEGNTEIKDSLALDMHPSQSVISRHALSDDKKVVSTSDTPDGELGSELTSTGSTAETLAEGTSLRGEPVNLNTADRREFESINGIGPVLAGRILEWREVYGPFKEVEDLLLVRGIGEKKLEQLRAYVTIGPTNDQRR